MPPRGHSTAPRFDPSKPRELRRYFDELDLLFGSCQIADNPEKKKFACHYVDIDTSDLWKSIPQHAAASTFQEFVTAVIKLYPGADDDRRWTQIDLDALVGEQLRLGIRTMTDLGNYYRSFFTITQYLITKGWMAEIEQGRAYARAFQPELWKSILRRLEVKLPDHYHDQPYSLSEVHEAAKFVLHGPSSIAYLAEETQSVAPVVKAESMEVIFDRFAATLIKALRPQQQQNSAQNKNSTRSDDFPRDRTASCAFCDEHDHFISKCRHVVSYIAEGKIRRNIEGRVVLPSGAHVPKAVQGRNLRERVDEWHKQNPNQRAVTEIVSGQQLMFEVQDRSAAAYALTTNERIAALEHEIYTLRNKEVFDGVELPRRRKPQQRVEGEIAEPAPPPKPKSKPANSTPTALKVTPKATKPIGEPANPPIHPFKAAREPAYLPPHERNFGAVPVRPAKDKDSAYRTQAPVQDSSIADDVYKRSMKTPFVTLTQQELLSLSPEVRQKVREAVTPKRLTTGDTRETKAARMVTIEQDDDDMSDEDDALPADPLLCGSLASVGMDGYVIPDPYECYLQTLAPGQEPELLTVAKESHALRSIFLLVDNQERIESIVDPGCQIVAMSEAVCHDLGMPYDPKIRLNMQSANGEIDQSLGLARNVPCRIGSITLYLQIHVIRAPAYDILLGRPFDVLTQSVVKNYANEDQTITIRDPNSGRIATIPTVPRGPPRHQKPPRRHLHSEDVDFQDSRN
jgi:hypothetical protein